MRNERPAGGLRSGTLLFNSALLLSSAVLLTQLVSTPCAAETEPSAEAKAVRAQLHCAPRTGKGRVLCDLDLDVTTGRLTWADLIITKAPSFALPLRDRVGMREATERSPTHLRLPFALIAQQVGEGEVTIKSRAVWCRSTASIERENCVSVSQSVSASVIATD